jgi:ABC-2 type transport system ATP-binding protein
MGGPPPGLDGGPPAGRWRVRFDGSIVGVGAAGAGFVESLRAAGFTPGDGGTWRLSGDPAALNAALDAARRAGALILEVGREGADLEAVLAAAVGGRP